MKVFVAGASGAIGRRLVPRLIATGHDVVAVTRDDAKAGWIRPVGARPVVADTLDRAAVVRAITAAAPDVVISQLTALTGVTNYKNFDKQFELTNLLRTRGTDNVIAGMLAAGVPRIVAQGWGNWNYARTGIGLKHEDDPFDSHPPKKQVESMAALRHLERSVTRTEHVDGVVLRYGNFYGPGTSCGAGGDIVTKVLKRQLPIVGNGAGVWSFVHVDDAASAAIAAMTYGAPGAYNIVDDEPLPVSKWLPDLAAALGAKPPRHVPTWLARFGAGEVGVSMMTRIRGTSNAKARAELHRQPSYPTTQKGFRSGLGDLPVPEIAAPPSRADHQRSAAR